MMFWGSIVNALAIILGSFIGITVKFKEDIRLTITQGLGLASLIIGIKMGLEHHNIIVPIASLVVGGFIGENLKLEKRLEDLGKLLGRSKASSETGRFNQGFITASLVFCVGALAVIGALESGLQHNHDSLYAKSMLDGVTAIFFASSFGIGVAFSAILVLVYQGGITLFASYLEPLLNFIVLSELTATGGLLIIGIGLNILGITKIKVGNLLPALVAAVVISLLF